MTIPDSMLRRYRNGTLTSIVDLILVLYRPVFKSTAFRPTLILMILCAITNRHLEGASFSAQRQALLARARLWALSGVDLVQLREKDLPAAELISLPRQMQQVIQSAGSSTRLVLNAPPEVARVAEASGVHLSASASTTVHSLFIDARVRNHLWVSVACHTNQQVEMARNGKADCILFAPIFEKQIADGSALRGVGIEGLAAACRAAGSVPVLALGGVTAENAAACLAAGASGIAAIRLFYGSPGEWERLR